LIERTRQNWSKELNAGVAVSFCSEPIEDDDGRIIVDNVILGLPADRSIWKMALMQFVLRTKSKGVITFDFRPEKVHVLLETALGSRSWIMTPEQHGDIKVLSRPTILDNVESDGLLWHRVLPSA
jgi:hypothetical protein